MDNPSAEMVARWLKGLDLPGYLQSFLDNGYDDLAVCQEIGPVDLDAIGVLSEEDRTVILDGVQKLRSHRDLNLGLFCHPVFDGGDDMTSFLLERYSHLTEKYERDNKCLMDGWSEIKRQWNIGVTKNIGDDVNKGGDDDDVDDGDGQIKSDDDDDDYKMFSVYGQSTRSYSPLQHLTFENRFDDDILDRKPSIRSLNRNNCATTGPKHSVEPPIESIPQCEDEERKEQGLKEQLIGSLSKFFRSLSFRKSPKKYSYEQYTGDLKASEMLMGEKERMGLMFQVKSGKLSVFEAVQRVNNYKCSDKPNNIHLQIIGKSRSMEEQNLTRHFYHHHHQQQHHRDQATPSPLAPRMFDHLRLPDRNRNQEISENHGNSPKLSPPPLPPLPPTAIMESLSAECLHPTRHHYHYRNEEEEDDDDCVGGVARMSVNHHQPDVVADHATYHNYRRLHHRHRHHHQHFPPPPALPPPPPPLPPLPPNHHRHHQHHHHRCHLHHHDGDISSFHDDRCQFCSVVRKSKSFHLAASQRSDLGSSNTPHLDRWADWNSTEELKTLKFLKQCTAERLKYPAYRFTTRQITVSAYKPYNMSRFNNFLQVNPEVASSSAVVAAPDCVPAYQRLNHHPHFHAIHKHHQHRQQSLPSSSSSSCDGWNDSKSDTRSLPVQRSGTLADLFMRIGLQHLTEKFMGSGKSTFDELADLSEDDLFKVGIEDELDRVKLLTVVKFMQDCRHYFGSLHTVRSQSPAAAISRDASIQTANET